MESLNAQVFLIASLLMIAAALTLVGVGTWKQYMRQTRSRRNINRALSSREERIAAAADSADSRSPKRKAIKIADDVGKRLEEGRFADTLLAEEDRKLVNLCGFQNAAQARSRFMVARLALMLALPMVAWWTLDGVLSGFPPILAYAMLGFAGMALGYLLPKWILLRRAAKRREAAGEELPLLIDLLKLLQGVGLSIDQSLQTVITEFGHVMPVLSAELRLANDVHSRGRTREQSLQRLSSSFDNDDLSAICKLITQVDKHGGAVQEPLARFGERVREKRKLDLKEKIGKLTVKMTGVMVLTLLPALLIITGGAGFLAVIRGLSRVAGS